MASSPVIAGITPLDSWGNNTTVAQALASLGSNSGNIMFTESLRRVLANASPSSFSLNDASLEGKSAIVIAAANWINEFEDFGWLANVIEARKLPTYLVGVGAQASLAMSIPKVTPGTLRLLKIVSERSNSISARGTFTCEVLNHYGIQNVQSTGCPSLLLAGPRTNHFVRPISAEHVVIHATRHGFGRCDEFQRYLYSQALKHNYDILLQSEDADIYYALGRTNNPEILSKAAPAVRFAYGIDDEATIADYLHKHGLFYINFSSWIEAMQTRTFCVGTRIHGTIASLIARTPALLIAHDSRTMEMAKAMHIPFITREAVHTEHDLNVEHLMAQCLTESLATGYQRYREQFMRYFAENDLDLSADFIASR